MSKKHTHTVWRGKFEDGCPRCIELAKAPAVPQPHYDATCPCGKYVFGIPSAVAAPTPRTDALQHKFDSLPHGGGSHGEGNELLVELLTSHNTLERELAEAQRRIAPAMREALLECVTELQRLRFVLLPHYEGKIGEPDGELISKARAALGETI